MSTPPAAFSPAPPRPGALRDVASVMLRLGCTAFGGPAAHVAMLREEVVRRRSWVSEQEFLDLLGASGLIPGPTSTEMAIHLGMRRAGVPGLWLAGLCFITPAVLITLAFAWAYVAFGALPAAQGALLGVKPAVTAIIAAALLGLGKTALKTAPLVALGAGALALYLVGVNELAVLLGSGVIGILLAVRRPPVAACLFWAGAPAVAAAPAAASPETSAIFLYFLKIGSVLFGSGYVLLVFVQQGLVHDLGWLTRQQLLDAVAVGQFTPGPLFSTATFIGYVVGGWPGAVAASVGIFLPSFLFVWATHGAIARLRQAPWSAGFLDGLNAGSLALMAGVAYQLARAALTGPAAWAILGAAALLLLRFRVNSAWIVLGAALLGVALHGRFG